MASGMQMEFDDNLLQEQEARRLSQPPCGRHAA
jgi:hypothetical protein